MNLKNKKNRLNRIIAMRDKIKNIYTKKRFKLLCSLSVLLHILGACWVLYTILYNPLGMNNSLNFGRYLIGLDDHNHNIENIFECWLLSIQIRYVITDFYVFYNAMINKRLLKHTIQIHGIESFVCCSIFFNRNDKDSFIFGLICLGWSFLWYISDIIIDFFD